MMSNKLAPSILDADFSMIKNVLTMLEKNNVDLIHLDIMDGHFVPNITFGPKFVHTIKKNTSLPLSVHLMISKPEKYIKQFAQTLDKNDDLIIHVEASTHLDRSLQSIIDLGIKAGVALNPSTSLESIRYVLGKIDVILIMSVNPGFGGQKFIPFMIQKIKNTYQFVKKSKKNIDIQVDGGINLENLTTITEAGANILVIGSEIFKSDKPEDIIAKIYNKLV